MKSIQTLFIEFMQTDSNWKQEVIGRLSIIEEQVKKTNGRVTVLEKDDVTSKVNWGKVGLLGTVALIAIGAITEAIVRKLFK